MSRFTRFLIVAVSMAAGALTAVVLDGCAAFRQAHGPRVVELLAEDCVTVAREAGHDDVADVCATVEELAPMLYLVKMQRRVAAARAKAAAQCDGGVCIVPLAPAGSK